MLQDSIETMQVTSSRITVAYPPSSKCTSCRQQVHAGSKNSAPTKSASSQMGVPADRHLFSLGSLNRVHAQQFIAIIVVFFNAYQNLPNLPHHALYFPYME